MVSGLTLAQAQDTLTTTMGRLLQVGHGEADPDRPPVRHRIPDRRGPVARARTTPLPVERVSQIITRAGGIAPLGSRTHIELIRNGAVYSIVDIERFETSGDLLANPFVAVGRRHPGPGGGRSGHGERSGFRPGRVPAACLYGRPRNNERANSEGIYELKPGERVSDVISRPAASRRGPTSPTATSNGW